MKVSGDLVVKLAAAVAVVGAVWYVSKKAADPQAWANAATSIGGAAVDVVDTVVGGAVVGTGELLGIPATNKAYAVQLMDEWDATPWYEKTVLSFKISAALPFTDYVKWLADSSYRPAY